MTRVALVVAVAKNGVIGKDNKLPWRLPGDLKHFRELTWGKPIVMGRKTFQSLGRPLPGRDNIVVSRSRRWDAGGVTVVPTVESALEVGARLADAKGLSEVMVIGGAQIYALALPLADRVYLTEIDATPDGDTFFPTLDPAAWRESERVAHPAAGEFPAHAFVVYDRLKSI